MSTRLFATIVSAVVIIIVIIGAGIALTNLTSHDSSVKLNLKKDKKAPDFTAVDQNNNTVTLDTYLGKVLMIDFIYTHCPNPNGTLGECSTETANMNNLLTILQNKGYTANDFHFISISIDWKYDNVTTMYNYGMDRGEGQFQYWSFLSGNQQQIENITSGYTIVAQYNNNTVNNFQPNLNNTVEYMSHSVIAYLIDKNGWIRILEDSLGGLYPITGTTWIPSDIANQIITLIQE